MIVTHFITFVIYLLSVIVYYSFYATWHDASDTKHTNEFYATWTLSVIFMTIVQAVLIYICWVLSADDHWIDTDETVQTTTRESETAAEDHHRKSTVSRNSASGSRPKSRKSHVSSLESSGSEGSDDSDYDHEKYLYNSNNAMKFSSQTQTEDGDSNDNMSVDSSEAAMEEQMRRTRVLK